MPDEPRHGDVGRHGTSSSAPGQDSYDRPTRRRRRSMEDSGGLSVSDLVAKHGSSRSDLKPVAPPPHVVTSEQPSGSHRLTAPTPPPTSGPPPATGTGSHRRVRPDEPPSQPRIAPRSVSPSYGMQPQGTGRTRSGNDTAPGQPTAPGANAGQSQKTPRPVAGGQRAATPRTTSSSRAAAPRRGGAQPGGQPSGPQRIPQQPTSQQPPAAGPAAARQQAPGQNSGQQRPVGGQWDGQQGRPERSGPLPAPGPLGGTGVAMPARNQRTGRPAGATRVPRGRTVTPPATRGNPMPAIPAPAPNPLPTTPQGAPTQLPAPAQAGPGSRPGMVPVGRQTATALAVPVRKPVPATETTVETPAASAPAPERREDIDPSCLTTEMEAISEVVQQKRKVDATLARFSAVHDEMAEEERVRRGRRVKLMPWLGKDDDMEEALSVPPLGSATEPEPPVEVAERAAAPGVSRLQEKLRRRSSRTLRSSKIAVFGVAVVVLVGCYFGWRAATHVTSSPIQEVAALDESSSAIVQSQKQYGDSNFLLVGTTSRPGASATGDQSTNTMMVAHIPVDGSRAVIVSFPPNLQVDRPACKQWNNQTNQVGGQVAAQPAVKLNSVYATGGPRCLTDTVQQLTGLRINHFVGIDLSGFRNLASSVGGVDMCVKAPLQDAALGTIVNRAGPVSLSGDQALNFVRADQIMGGTGVADFTRIDRQQKFLAALLRKSIGQQNLLMDASLLNNFLGAFTTSTFGDNMGVSSLSKLATSLQGLALGRITFVTLPTTGTLNQAGAETVNADTSKQLFTAVIDNAPLPGESAGTAASANLAAPNAATVTPQSTKIQVINATNTQNVATTTANALSQQGFVIVGKGGLAPPNVQQTVIKYAAAQQDQARLLASAVPSATLQVDPSMFGAIQLIIGPGFDRKVQAPQAGGSNGATAGGGSEAPAQLSYVNAADTSCA